MIWLNIQSSWTFSAQFTFLPFWWLQFTFHVGLMVIRALGAVTPKAGRVALTSQERHRRVKHFKVRLIVILYSPNSYFFYCWICIMLCTSFLPMHILVWLYFILYSRTYSTTKWIILELIHLLIAWLYLQVLLGGKACFPVGKKGRKRLITKHLQSDQLYSWKLFHDFQKIESLYRNIS